MCVCHLPEPLEDAFRRHTCMIVPLVQPPGQGMWALGLRCVPLDLCIPGGSRAQTAALRSSWPRALPLPFYPTSVVVWPGGSLNLTSFAAAGSSGGVCGLPFKLRAPDLQILLSACTCAGQAQGARQAGAQCVRLLCLARLCVEKVTKQMGQARALSWGHCLQTLSPGQYLLDAKWRLLLPGPGGQPARVGL